MNVEVRISGLLRYYLRESEKSLSSNRLDVPEGTTTGRILKMFDFPQRLSVVFIVNGSHAIGNRVLQEGDTISLTALVSGG